MERNKIEQAFDRLAVTSLTGEKKGTLLERLVKHSKKYPGQEFGITLRGQRYIIKDGQIKLV